MKNTAIKIICFLRLKTAEWLRVRCSAVTRSWIVWILATVFAAGGFVRADTFGSGTNEFTIDFVTVGDGGNPDDSDSGIPFDYFAPYGGVDYAYRIGTYEISRDMITKANAEGGLGITLYDMTSYGGNIGTHPATGISWNEAARFVNWLNDQAGASHAYKFALQPGDIGYDANANIELWTSGDAGYNPSNPYRNADAHYFLPTDDEWYKAAFYTGSGGDYWDYSTQQNDLPTPVANGTNSMTVVYLQAFSQGPADIDDAGGLSHYGTMAQSGNVWEWMENAYDGTNDVVSEERGYRGGYWYSGDYNIGAEFYDGYAGETYTVGFRVAGIPVSSELLITNISFNGSGDALISFTPGGAGFILISTDDLDVPFTENTNAVYDTTNTFTVPAAFLNPSNGFFRVEMP